jgi:hypothetical protein
MTKMQTVNSVREDWGLAWFLGTIVTLDVVLRVSKVWHTYDSFGNWQAGLLLAILVVYPAGVIGRIKRGQSLSRGYLVSGTYLILMLAMMTFRG